MLIPWNGSLAVGHPAIDNDHRHLVALINRLHEAMLQRRGKDIGGGVLAELVQYTKDHFTREEGLMDAQHYSGGFEHKKQHKDLCTKLNTLVVDHEQSKITISMDTMRFLEQWLTNHIASNCSGSWLFGGVEQRWEYAAEGDLDGRQRGLGVEPGGIDDGTISGVDPGAPVRAEAVGDLTEGDGGPERLFAAVVGRWDISVFEEDEEFRSPRLDLALRCGAGLQRDREGDAWIEPALGLGVMGLQCRSGRRRPTRIAHRGWSRSFGAKTSSPASMAYWMSRKTWARQTRWASPRSC